jgi:hypothetical protein
MGMARAKPANSFKSSERKPRNPCTQFLTRSVTGNSQKWLQTVYFLKDGNASKKGSDHHPAIAAFLKTE